MATTKDKKSLDNLRREEFCQLYVSREFFGNGVESYLEVYDVDRSKPNWYRVACSSASRLLTNEKVYERINELLDDKGLNDQHVDKQLLFLVNQHADFGSKLGAVREYNKLKARIIEKRELAGPDGGPIGFIDMTNASDPEA